MMRNSMSQPDTMKPGATASARFEAPSHLRRVIVALAAVGAYVLAFFPLYRLVGGDAGALATLPVAAVGWLWGYRAGLLAGVLAFPLNTLLLNLVGTAGWDVAIQIGGRPGHVVLILIGAGVGRLRDLGERLKRELAECQQAEAALGQARQNYEALVNSIDGIVWEADPRTFEFSFVSKQAKRLLGYPIERWLAEPAFWQAHLHPDDREWAVAFCVKATTEKRDHEFEYRIIAADGRTV